MRHAAVRLLLASWTLLPAALAAEDAPKPPPEPAHTAAITAEEYRWANAWLSDDAREGREAGTPGCREAAEWIAARMKAMGLEALPGAPGHLQPFDLPGGVPIPEECLLEVRHGEGPARAFSLGKDWVVMEGSGSAEVDAGVVFAGYGITAEDLKYDDFAGVDCTGKVVVVLRHEPREKDPKSRWNGDRMTRHSWFPAKVAAARKAGAAAVVIVNDLLNHEEDSVHPAAVGGAGQALPVAFASRAFTEEILKGSGATPEGLQKAIDEADAPASRVLEGVRVRVKARTKAPSTDNVVGAIRGRDPALREEWIVVGAHYDHVGKGFGGGLDPRRYGEIHNGADDNASGTAALLEIAEHFALSKERPRRSLLFLAFSGEEKGLLGAAHFVAHPLVPVERMAAMVNLDMVGRYRPGQFDVVGADSGSTLRAVMERAAEGLDLELDFTNSGMANSDGFCFYNAKVPTVFLFTGLHDDYHRPGDDWWRINVEGAVRVATMAARAVLSLADADGRPEYRPLPRSEFAMNRRNRVVLGVVMDEEGGGRGATLREVSGRSPAAAAGMKPGDVVVSFGGREIGSADDLRSALNRARPGDEVPVRLRRGEATVDLKVRFPGPAGPVFGVVFDATPDGRAGALVQEVAAGSVAEAAGLRVGDRILKFGAVVVTDGPSLPAALRTARAGAALPVRVAREGKELDLEAKFPQ